MVSGPSGTLTEAPAAPLPARGQGGERHEREREQPDGQESLGVERLRDRWMRAGDGPVDGVEPSLDPVGEPAGPEVGRHVLAEDAAGDRVREGGLVAVAHLDPRPPVVHEHDEQDAVVEPLLAEPPGLEEARRVVLEVLAVEGAEDGHRDLVRALPLALQELLLEPRALGRGEQARVVADPAGRSRRHGEPRVRRRRQRQEGDAGGDGRPADAAPRCGSPPPPCRCHLAPPGSRT
jgi:hypothetical protein